MRALVRNGAKSGCGVGKHHFVPLRQQARRGGRRNEASASVSVSGARSGRRSERAFDCRASVTEPEPPQNGVQSEEPTFQEQVEMLDRQSDNLDR